MIHSNMYAVHIHFFFFFKAKDILAIHNSHCPNPSKHVQASLDGVAECKSNLVSLDVYSIRFDQCHTIYPLQILRPLGKYRVDQQLYLDNFLTDLCSNGCKIDAFVGDNLKRAIARLCKTHASYFPCEYCEAKGTLLNQEDEELKEKKETLKEEKESILNRMFNAQELNDEEDIQTLTILLKNVNDAIKSLNRKSNNIVWPASSANGQLRTVEKVIEISDRIEDGEILSLDEAKGIIGRSLFLDIPYFNVVQDIPPEYLHSGCIGVVKRVVELTFNVGESRPRITSRKLSSVDQFNKLMLLVLVPREYSRRARNLDFSVIKGQEFRNYVLVFFPIIVICIEEGEEERRLWLVLAYMFRACVLPDNEYAHIDPNVVKQCGKEFYALYEQLFGPHNCSYNTHVVGSHIDIMRIHGPLTLTSAFGFESFYGELRHSFVPGTASPLKQILEKVLLKRALSSHCCKRTIYYSPKDTALESNSNIYTFNDNGYNFFKIINIDHDDFHCQKFENSNASFPETPNLNWSKVGVFKAGVLSNENEIVTISRANVAGKFLHVDKLFITCPINVLEEK